MAKIIKLADITTPAEAIKCETCGENDWAMWGHTVDGMNRLSEMICLLCGAEMKAEIIE